MKYSNITKKVGRKKRHSTYITRDLYMKLILKYSRDIGGTTTFGVPITQQFLDVLRIRYNELRPDSVLEI